MHSRVHYFGNPIHPALITLPAGLFVGSFVFDLVYLFDDDDTTWFRISQYMIIAGIVGGLVAAVPGFIDYLFIPRDLSAKTWGMIHGLLNVTSVVLMFISSLVRWGEVPATDSGELWAAYVLSWIAIAITALAGSIGGHLVYHLNIGNANFPKYDRANLTPKGTEQHKHEPGELEQSS